MELYDTKTDRARILTLENVAQYLRVHPSTIYRLLKKRQLPAFKVGRDWRFNLESIDRWRTDAERSRGAAAFPAENGKHEIAPWESCSTPASVKASGSVRHQIWRPDKPRVASILRLALSVGR
jgi:excisionase family DNA binding protein